MREFVAETRKTYTAAMCSASATRSTGAGSPRFPVTSPSRRSTRRLSVPALTVGAHWTAHEPTVAVGRIPLTERIMRHAFNAIRVAIAAFTRASKVWSARMRQLRMWKIGTVFAVFGAITIATSHLESYAQQRAHDLVGQACWSGGVEALPACLVGLITYLTMQVSVLFGLLTAILFVVYAYTYTLKGLSTYLPWYLSLGVSSGLFVLGRFQAPVAHLLVEVLVHGYPCGLQAGFLAVAACGAPLA